MWISRLKRVRKTIMVLGIANLAVIVSGGVLTLVANSNCDSAGQLFPLYAVCVAACVKLAAMVKVGSAQELMAMTIMDSPTHYSLQRKVPVSFSSLSFQFSSSKLRILVIKIKSLKEGCLEKVHETLEVHIKCRIV